MMVHRAVVFFLFRRLLIRVISSVCRNLDVILRGFFYVSRWCRGDRFHFGQTFNKRILERLEPFETSLVRLFDDLSRVLQWDRFKQYRCWACELRRCCYLCVSITYSAAAWSRVVYIRMSILPAAAWILSIVVIFWFVHCFLIDFFTVVVAVFLCCGFFILIIIFIEFINTVIFKISLFCEFILCRSFNYDYEIILEIVLIDIIY